MAINATWERRYILLSEAYYAEDKQANNCVDEVYFGLFNDRKGKADCEVSVVWYRLHTDQPLAIRIECFEEGWRAFGEFGDLFARVARCRDHPTPHEFCDMLRACGFVDGTPRPTLDAVMAGIQHVGEV